MIVVVSGQARKVGKTRAVCDIVAATPEARWIAVKITPHAHEPAAGGSPDTDRYLASGAAEAYLTHASAGLPDAHGRNLIVESNSILETLEPDLAIFVTDSVNQDWKASANVAAARADFTVEREITPAVVAAVRQRLTESQP